MMEYHEAANIFPMMEGDAYVKFVADIKANGLKDAIELLDGKILDGRNRHKACLEAGVEPRFKTVVANDPVGYVLSANLHRRHLNKSMLGLAAGMAQGLWEKYAAEALKRKQEGGREAGRGRPMQDNEKDEEIVTHPIRAPQSRDHIGAQFGVSGPTVDCGRKVDVHGVPELIEAIRHGKMSIFKGAKLAIATPEVQREVLKTGRAFKPRQKPIKMTLTAKSLSTATLSQKIVAMRGDIAAGLKPVDIFAHYAVSRSDYAKLRVAVESGKTPLIEALDSGLLSIGMVYSLSKKTDEEIAKAIEDARLAVARKNYKPLSAGEKTKPEFLLDVLERTWVNWRGLEEKNQINSKWIPKNKDRLADMARLCREVRSAVNNLLDRIEKEMG